MVLHQKKIHTSNGLGANNAPTSIPNVALLGIELQTEAARRGALSELFVLSDFFFRIHFPIVERKERIVLVFWGQRNPVCAPKNEGGHLLEGVGQHHTVERAGGKTEKKMKKKKKKRAEMNDLPPEGSRMHFEWCIFLARSLPGHSLGPYLLFFVFFLGGFRPYKWKGDGKRWPETRSTLKNQVC